MVTNEYAIEIINLKKSYGNRKVLDGINLKIKYSSIFCLLGINGAGKTTLIKTLATLLPIDEGDAYVCENDVKGKASNVRKVISLTGQYAAVDELLTARENLIMAAKLFHLKNAKIKAEELLFKFNLQDYADLKVSKYSGGMRRRLDIAMSLVGNPQVIFLDEPTTGLDPQSRIEMWEFIKKLTMQGITIFLTTQYLEEAEALADQIAILHCGKMIIDGTLEELKNQITGTKIHVTFVNKDDLNKALVKIKEYDYTVDEKTLTLSIFIDRSVKKFAKILTMLEDLEISKVEQQRASLEEVFLTFTNMNLNREIGG